ITAYDQHAVKAFELEAIGYLLKPFSLEEFTKVINKAKQQIEMHQKVMFNERIEHLWQRMKKTAPEYLEHIEIKEKGLIKQINIIEVCCIVSDSEYIQIQTLKNNYLYRQSLEIISNQLPPHFRRVHRSNIINVQKIKTWKYLNNGTYQFELTNHTTLKSSRSYQESIKKWLSE
ncbi:LytR/AlgR family response regulator transcription factor, partial [Fulvivirga lutimaris]|uniref:LytR/AlgR family response regulator transcription factor n=1 Tax=Fulvivirga lutimaris TaxID=1819566 RepID=UPI001627C06F